jgi:formiminoglutamate deiminase
MYRLADRLDPESYFRLARAVYGEMVLAGITAVGEFHYLHHQAGGTPYADPNEMGMALVAAAAEAGIRLTLLDTCYLRASFDEPPRGTQSRFSDGSVEAWAERVTDLGTHPAVVVGAAVHSVRAVDVDSARVVAGWAGASNVPLHFHLSEQPAENEAALGATGMTPTALLAEAGALGPLSTAVHGTHLSPDDIARLGQSGTTVCFCPTTERELGDGIGPATRLQDAGARLAVGSDGQSVIDILEEARLVELHNRLAHGARGSHSGSDLLSIASGNGMKSLGWRGGRLEVGYQADLTTVSLDTVRTAGIDDPLAAVMFAANRDDVTDVVVGGRHVVRAGRHLLLGDVASQLEAAIGGLVG